MTDPGLVRANGLLAALPPAVLERIARGLTIWPISRDEVLYRPGEPMERITFPLSGLYSLVITDPRGSFTSISTVGREGAVELAPALGSIPAPTEIVCLIAGDVVQMAAADVRKLLDETPEFREPVYRYLGARMIDCMQVSACHRLHPIEARMARCLLTTRDRVESDEFPCTHELLAGLLGASRPKVSLALEALQVAGSAVHRRGVIRILDPAALEAMTCGCYRTIREAFDAGPAQ